MGRVPDLLCGNVFSHPSLIPTLDENDNILLKCIDPDCNYFRYPGLKFYENLKSYVERIENTSV